MSPCNQVHCLGVQKSSRTRQLSLKLHDLPCHSVIVHRQVITMNARVMNLDHVRDYEYTVQVNRWFLKPMGIWPDSASSTTAVRVLVKLQIIICHALIMFVIVPSVLFIVFEEMSMQARMKTIGPLSHWVMSELNYCCLLMRTKDIRCCVEHVRNDWRTVKRASDRGLMLKNSKVGRYIACIAAVCMNIGTFSYIILTGFHRAVFHVGNESYTMYRLLCPFYVKLVDTRFSPANEIVFFTQLISLLVVNSVTVGACGLGSVLAMHACGQLDVVMARLDELVDSRSSSKPAEKKFAVIVERHMRSLSFVTQIEKVMHQVCLVELVGCTLNMCMLEYYFLTDKNRETSVTYVAIFASMSFNIFIFCYIGEKLTEQCKKVGERAYMTDWYLLPRKTVLGLVMIISRSRLVIKITAGKLIQMSVATFGDVFKTSFGYFNMLRTVTMTTPNLDL